MHDLIPLLVAHGALMVFAFTVAARAGVPVPAAPLLVVAGGAAAAGRVSLPAVFLTSILANVIGDAVWFVAGRWRGYRVMKLLCRISLSPDTCVRQSESLLVRWGGGSLIAAKFLPGVSVVAAPMAGALHMSWQRFLAFEVLAAAVWTGLYLGVGLVFAHEIDHVLDIMASAGQVAAVALGAALVLLLAWRWSRRRWMASERYAPRITVHELRELMRRGEQPVVIDVRFSGVLRPAETRVPGALSFALAQLPEAIAQLPRDREIILYCDCPNEASAVRGVRVLGQHGLHRARALKGGLQAWVEVDSVSPLQPVSAPTVAFGTRALP